MPCFAIVGTVGFRNKYPQTKENALELMENARRLQLKIAARRGNLDFFRCKTCRLSLAQIVTEEKGSWTRAELWCGENDCAMRLATATPFSVCLCYEQVRQLGTVDKFYGCRNLASMMIQCARCFDKCAGCMEEELRSSCLLKPGQPMVPAAVWRRRLYDFQDMLFDSQTRIIDAIDQPGLNLKLAILDRESTRFDTVLEALITRELLLNERKALRQMVQGPRRAPRLPKLASEYEARHQEQVREKLIYVNEKLKEYGRLFGGRLSGEYLEILSQRAQLLLMRRHLIVLLIHEGSSSPILKAQLAVNGTRWKALVREMEVAREKNPIMPRMNVASRANTANNEHIAVSRAEEQDGYAKDWPLRVAPA
ncbi:hypothetical protein B0H67DRAFT_98264 [Lasiosphaeris hirsuta]|uniref:Uncharacterized protein n=1 Tax=Lasiosphaeris hirsuta TaxID=260670 RepID=A0AA40DIL6_9PEZI|nr:hypothetical protein B0H67DRAFT_98264 [Lasiosphaeris hirsuta]